MNRKRIGVDLAKSVFQVAESEVAGKISQRYRFTRDEFQQYLRQQPPAEVVMEACGSSHYWGRVAEACGHTPVLLHARDVSRYRRGNKTDRNDCAAILEAARCADIKPVPVKSVQQQNIQHLHAMREHWKKARTMAINLLRSLLREQGVETANRTADCLRQAAAASERPECALLAPQLHMLLAEVHQFEEWMDEAEATLKREYGRDEIVQRIDDVSGVGLLTASAFVAAIGRPERFPSGRTVSAWLGMTPKEHSSGQQRRLGRISKAGNVYVRTLLIHGARSALLAAKRCAKRTPEKLTALQQWALAAAERLGHNKAAVALANKMARICWAVWRHARRFSGDYLPPQAA